MCAAVQQPGQRVERAVGAVPYVGGDERGEVGGGADDSHERDDQRLRVTIHVVRIRAEGHRDHERDTDWRADDEP